MRYCKKFLREALILSAALLLVLSFAGCGGGGGGGADSFTISYDKNGAESGTVPASQHGDESSSLAISDNTGNLAKSGYLFDGWNTSADGSGTDYIPGSSYKGDNLTLYAKWAAIFKVEEIGGGSPAPAINGVQKAPGSSTLKILGLTEKGMTLVEIDIPQTIDGETITAIANGAFQDCSQIQAITIPETVTSIEGNAFAGCTNLTTIVMLCTTPPELGAGALSGCPATVHVPDSATGAYTTDPNWSTAASIKGYDPAVGAIILSSIAITSAPSKVLYVAGVDSFSSSGLVITATYTDGSSHTVSPSSLNADTSSAGIKTLTVTYTEDGVTKNASTKYYVRRADAITESPIEVVADSLYAFGDFPQTVSAISEYSDAPVYNGWYLGSDGYFYDKVRAWPYDNDIDTDPTFSNGTDPVYGQEYYFKVEPIQWKQLTDNYNSSGKVLLLSDKILRGTNGYNNDGGIVYYYTAQTERTIGGKVYANNYKYSSVRAYLNGSYESGDPQTTTYNGAGFLQKAFTATAQGKIATTVVKNDEENMRGNYNNNDEAKLTAYKSDNTNDKVFLLSAFGPEYTLLYTSGERQRSPSDYALATRVRRSNGQTGGFWLTRTPECDEDYPSNKAPDVSPYRYAVLHYNSNGNPNYADTDYPGIVGIAPAITIDPSNLP